MPPPATPGPLLYDPDSFDAPSAHVAMLDDVTRTQGLLRAIRETVRPGDVVVDIGSGTGILAVAAAKAGACRVYAIEQGKIANAAEAMVAANNVGDIVRVIRGHSSRVELPERADVLVSEILGADPLDESLLEVFRDARTRLLKPEARLIPCAVLVYGLPVKLPPRFVARNTFSARNLERWRNLYNINFDGLGPYGAGIHRLSGIPPQEAKTWQTVADPCLLTRIRLDRDFEVAACSSTSFTANSAATNLGILVYFDVQWSASVSLSTNPNKVSEYNHWSCRVWCFPDKPSVQAGERIDLEYVHDRDIVEVRLAPAAHANASAHDQHQFKDDRRT